MLPLMMDRVSLSLPGMRLDHLLVFIEGMRLLRRSPMRLRYVDMITSKEKHSIFSIP